MQKRNMEKVIQFEQIHCLYGKKMVDILIPAKSFCIGQICIDYLNL